MIGHAGDEPVVYIVDDDDDVRNGLKSLLESVKLKCETFQATDQFLQHRKDDRPSCLVLDVRLPGSSGLDFQKELQAAGINVPIIFISGHGDIPMTVKAMKAGAFGFFSKPLHEQDLLDSIHAALLANREGREQHRALADLKKKYDTLTQREQQVLKLVTSGLLNKQVGAKIGLSEVTVKVHRHNIMKKFGAKSLAELVRIADSLGVN